MRLKDRVVLVTGAAHGIGRAIADLCAQEGARIVAVDLDEEAAGIASRELSEAGAATMSIRADVSVPLDAHRAVEDAVNAFGRLDVVVNNAAIFDATDPLEMVPEAWTRVVATNLGGPFLIARAASRHFIESGQPGAIINIASIQGYRSWPELWPYAAAKGGLHSLTRAMARYLGPYGVRVNSVSPGAIARVPTDDRYSDERFMERVREEVALGRMGDPLEVAEAVVFLASDAAGYITGADLLVDGGLLANGPSI